MQAQQLNVIGLTTGSVNEDIIIFLNDEKFSSGTRTAYLHDIKLFFSFMNKNFDSLSIHDLQYENKDIIRYRNFLINDLHLSKSTTNTKIAALQSLYAYFKRNRYDIKYSIDCEVFKIKKLKFKTNSYGYLSPEEVETMIQIVKTQVKGIEKSLLIRLATRTSLREDTLLNLTWDNIIRDSEQDCYFVCTTEKKTEEEVKQPISNTLYNELIQIKQLTYYQRYKDNKIFHVTTKTICDMMATLRKEINIPEGRNIVFHSFRNYGSNFILESTGDIVAAQMQLGHSDMNITYKNYVNKQRNASQMAGLLLDEQQDQEAFNKLTFDEMKQLLNDTKNGIRTQLIREATKIIDNRSDT